MKRNRVAFTWDRDAFALQSNGDICSSSSEELKRYYLHTKGFAAEQDHPLGACEYNHKLGKQRSAHERAQTLHVT